MVAMAHGTAAPAPRSPTNARATPVQRSWARPPLRRPAWRGVGAGAAKGRSMRRGGSVSAPQPYATPPGRGGPRMPARNWERFRRGALLGGGGGGDPPRGRERGDADWLHGQAPAGCGHRSPPAAAARRSRHAAAASTRAPPPEPGTHMTTRGDLAALWQVKAQCHTRGGGGGRQSPPPLPPAHQSGQGGNCSRGGPAAASTRVRFRGGARAAATHRRTGGAPPPPRHAGPDRRRARSGAATPRARASPARRAAAGWRAHLRAPRRASPLRRSARLLSRPARRPPPPAPAAPCPGP